MTILPILDCVSLAVPTGNASTHLLGAYGGFTKAVQCYFAVSAYWYGIGKEGQKSSGLSGSLTYQLLGTMTSYGLLGG